MENSEKEIFFGSVIDAAKRVITSKIDHLEEQLKSEIALKNVAQNRLEIILIQCRKAMEEGRLDKETYENISLIRTNGSSVDYIPNDYEKRK